MAIYVDPFYTYHKALWARLRIPYIESVGTNGSWEALNSQGWDVVTGTTVDLPDAVKIDPDDGSDGFEGPLSEKLRQLDEGKMRRLPTKMVRAEEQRAEAGSTPHADKAILAALTEEDQNSGSREASSLLDLQEDRPVGGFGDGV